MSKTRSLLLDFETDEVGRLARKSAKEKKALIKAFSDASDVVRERALIASIDLTSPEIVTDIAKALTDDVQDVRIAAAQALAFYRQPRTVPILLGGLKDESTWVRSHCAVGLSKLLNGPIWARLSSEDIDKFVEDFPEMADEDINNFLSLIKMKGPAISNFMNWRSKGFDIDIDMTILVKELEGTPILLSEETTAEAPKTAGVSDEVEEILRELPEEILTTLPPEDIRRLTPTSARELVDQLKESIPTTVLPKKKKKKKKKVVKVRKVKKVVKKKKATAKDKLIKKLPAEVRRDIGEETLGSLSVEELEALLATSPEAEEPEVEPEPETKPADPRMQGFVEKYGDEKAELLITIPEVMLEGIPEEQIVEMDLETLKGLTQALEPRE
ncbi:MAG: HEAT repeat domain-containing protein [Candidatus Thorarchaeota archaeon]|nr:MAG: HEAT repeat domain-containing protein [Candidatus Thorarchaeota archaeon]